jgi:hypothetical protein
VSAWRACGALLLLLGLAACAVPSPGPSPTPNRLVAHTTQAGDVVVSKSGSDDFEVWITSEKGIGKANFERTAAPPRSLTFYLRLKGLEEFRLAWGDVTVTGHYPSSGGAVRQELARAGGPSAPIDETSLYWMPVRTEPSNAALPLQDGDFVLTAPAQFIQDAPEQFRLEWIDFYR